MNTNPVIVDQRGRPISSSMFGVGKAPYSAAAMDREVGSWLPVLNTADGDLLQNRDLMVARTQDMIRNHGIASGAVQIHLDNVIGTGLRLVYKPDFKVLGIDPEVAKEFARDVEAKHRAWAEDNIDFSSDAGLRLTQGGRLAQGYRSYLATGEVLGVGEYIKRGFPMRTAIQMVDPLRLSNPMNVQDRLGLRSGVELDKHGAATAYYIREASVMDQVVFGMNTGVGKWKRVTRSTAWGRGQVLHLYDQERPGQTRGKPAIASVLSKMKMLEKLDQVTLQAAIVNAMYAAVIESPLPTDSVAAALGASNNPLLSYMTQKQVWGENGPIKYDGVKVPQLYPGEELKLMTAERSTASFEKFTEKALQHISGGFNLSYEMLARDYSKSNYSSARAAMLEAWRFFNTKRHTISAQQATWEFALWFEEAIDKGIVVLPKGAPDFYTAKASWLRCFWIGPGRENIDPLKEGKAAREEYELGITTFEQLCAEKGRDWEEVLEQRAYERQRMIELGIDQEVGQPRTGANKQAIEAEDTKQQEEDDADEKKSTQEVTSE